MKIHVNAGENKFVIDGASIRVLNKTKIRTGVVVLLPKVEIFIGSLLTYFIEALDVSRLPIALNRTICKGNYETYDVVRLATGSIHEVTVATLSVYSGVVVGVTFNKALRLDTEFRQKVALGAMHQIVMHGREERDRPFSATKCISYLTGVAREKMVVTQTAKSIKVRTPYQNEYKIPIYYVFTLTENNSYALAQVSYDYNEIARILRSKGV